MSLEASVLVPTYNEEASIEGCLEAVAAQSIGPDRLEVLLADGQSTDRTVEIAEAAAARLGFGRFAVVPNPDRRTAPGMRRALDEVTTPLVVRADARSRIQPDHVAIVRDVLAARPEVGVVGGAQVPIERPGVGTVGRGIARALRNRYSTGFGRYRRGMTSGPADTVWMGAFRTDDLRAIGGWDPEHGINEDYELNTRFRSSGAVVWFDARLRSGYLPRADLRSLARQYFSFGRSKGSAWAQGGRPVPRQWVLVLGPPVVALAGAAAARRVGVAPTAAAAGSALALVDHLGNRGDPAAPAVRASAMAATLVFGATWWAGVAAGLVQTGGAGTRPPSWRSA